MASKLFSDWLAFCKGESAFEHGHFYTLLMDGLSSEEIKLMFMDVLHSDELTTRLNNILNSSERIVMNNVNRNIYISNLVLKDLNEKLKICKKEGDRDSIDLIEKVKTIEISFVARDEYERVENEPTSCNEIMDVVTDFMWDSLDNQNDIISELIEACYGYGKDYNLVLYLLAPYINSEFNSEYYHELWQAGAVYLVSDDGLFIWDRNAS